MYDVELVTADVTYAYRVNSRTAFSAILRARALFRGEYPHFYGTFTGVTSRSAS